jgi:MOSC domain-containing protein YiiM
MASQLISVNIGQAQPLPNVKASGKSGIYKRAVQEPTQVTTLGLVGDTICDTENHGGVDQAVYVYSQTDYDWWEQELGYALAPGTFGENLTVGEFDTTEVQIGDRLYVGSVILEVTSPRVPCVTLAARMGDPTFVKRFRQAERPGFYCRVIQEGYVQQEDPVRFEPYGGETMSLTELFRDFYEPTLTEATLRRYLAAPIAIRDRLDKEKQLAQLLSQLSG